jgi:hypothetical protein
MSKLININDIKFKNDILNIFKKVSYDDYKLLMKTNKHSIEFIIKQYQKSVMNNNKITNDLNKFENDLFNQYLNDIILYPKRKIQFNVVDTTIKILNNKFNNKDDINLIIGNQFNRITPILSLNKKHNNLVTDIAIFYSDNNNKIREGENKTIMKLKNNGLVRKYYGDFNMTINRFESILATIPINTYDNIIVQYPRSTKPKTYLNFYTLFPSLFSQTIMALSVLKENGNMLITFVLHYPLASFKQMIDLIIKSFKYVSLIQNFEEDIIGLECNGYSSIYFNEYKDECWKIIRNFDVIVDSNNVIDSEKIMKINPNLFYQEKSDTLSDTTISDTTISGFSSSTRQKIKSKTNKNESTRKITKSKSKLKSKTKSKLKVKSNTKTKNNTKSKTKSRSKSKSKTKSSSHYGGGKNILILHGFNFLPKRISHKSEQVINMITQQFINYYTNVNYKIIQYNPLDIDKLVDMYITEYTIKLRNIISTLIETNFMPSKEYLGLQYQMQNNYLSDVLILNNNIHFEILDYNNLDLDTTYSPSTKIKSNIMSVGINVDKFLNNMELDKGTLSDIYSTSIKSSRTKTKYKKNKVKNGLDLLLVKANPKDNNYENIRQYYNRIEIVFNKRTQNELDGTYKYSKEVLELSEDYKGGIKHYLNKKFNLDPNISNGFVKLWEVYHTFNLLPKKGVIRTFHFAEAPGQFILATQRFLEKRTPGKNTHLWKANSLNPKHNKSVFGDIYGLIKDNQNNWLWGDDNTGDITKSKNILWFKKELSKWTKNQPIDCLTGDGGISSSSNIILMQKLDYAQMCIVATCCSPGKNCVVKIFLPFIRTAEQATTSTPLYISILYLYKLMFRELHLFKPYSSDPTSGEFYIIGKGFMGVDFKYIEKLMNILDNFKENHVIFGKSDIPDYFKKQFYSFIDVLSYYNTRAIERFNFLSVCFTDGINKEKCEKYLDNKNIDKIKNLRYQKWVQMFKFQ